MNHCRFTKCSKFNKKDYNICYQENAIKHIEHIKKNILCCSCYLDLFFIDTTLYLEIVNTVTDKAMFVCKFIFWLSHGWNSNNSWYIWILRFYTRSLLCEMTRGRKNVCSSFKSNAILAIVLNDNSKLTQHYTLVLTVCKQPFNVKYW